MNFSFDISKFISIRALLDGHRCSSNMIFRAAKPSVVKAKSLETSKVILRIFRILHFNFFLNSIEWYFVEYNPQTTREHVNDHYSHYLFCAHLKELKINK